MRRSVHEALAEEQRDTGYQGEHVNARSSLQLRLPVSMHGKKEKGFLQKPLEQHGKESGADPLAGAGSEARCAPLPVFSSLCLPSVVLLFCI